MTPEQFRTLSRGKESDLVDFKEQAYPDSTDGRIEFVKDLMAFANRMSPSSAPAHILLGVAEEPDGSGRVVGIDSATILDDAIYQSWVKDLLNRTPEFSVSTLALDGQVVGAITVRPGGRPFFPIRDRGGQQRLRRFESWVRRGTLKDVASPDEILRWAEEDNPIRAAALQLEVQEREARLRVCPHLHLREVNVNAKGGYLQGLDAITGITDTLPRGSFSIVFSVENHGHTPFAIRGSWCEWLLEDAYGSLPTIRTDVTFFGGSLLVMPGAMSDRLSTSLPPESLLQHLQTNGANRQQLDDWAGTIVATLYVECWSESAQREGRSSIQMPLWPRAGVPGR